MIPTVNVDNVSQGVMGVHVATLAALQQFGNATVAFFLEQVPERGEQLWLRMKAFAAEHKGSGFTDFVKNTVTANPIKMFYPKECTLDMTTRTMLASEVQQAIGGLVRSNDDLLGIYFGDGPVYQKARSVSCKGCPMRQCRHYVRS